MPGCRATGTLHNHTTVEEVRRCWHRVYFPAPTPPAPASPPPRRNWRDDPVTDAQLRKVEQLNGDAVHAHKLTKGECSDYIEKLMKEPQPVTSPAPTMTTENPKLKMVKGMIDLVPDGNYATAPQGENRHVDFVRITRPMSGQYRGKLHIQTRHSDQLKTRIVGLPGGYWEMHRRGAWNVLDMLMEIIQDYKTCAMRYSIEAKACSHCATPLTDDRSRHYLVGPICEKVHGYTWPVEFADEQNGMTFEQLQSRGMPFGAHHKLLLNGAA